MSAQQPAEFIGRKLHEGSAAAFRLSVALADGSQTLLDRYPATLGEQELVDRIEERSERHARMGPTVALFVVEAIDDKGDSAGCETFRVSANSPGRLAATEPANETGLLAQLMRHNEATQRTLHANVASMLDHMRHQVEESRARDADALAARFKLLEVTESLLSQRSERELAAEQAKSREEMKREGMQKLLTLGQVAVSHLAAKNGGEGSQEIAQVMSAVRVFETLDGDQLRAILSVLAPEQQAVLVGLLQTMARKKEGGADAQH